MPKPSPKKAVAAAPAVSFSTDSHSVPTTYVGRVCDGLTLLCGKTPPKQMVEAWLAETSEELQGWVACNSIVVWTTGIGTIEAAMTLAETPEEGIEHEENPFGQD